MRRAYCNDGRQFKSSSSFGGEQDMSVMEVLTLLILIADVIGLVVDICNKKKKK